VETRYNCYCSSARLFSHCLDLETAKYSLCGLGVKMPPVTISNHSTVEAISLSALPIRTQQVNLADLSSHNPFLILNLKFSIKKGSCEYQLLKSFGLTQPGNCVIFDNSKQGCGSSRIFFASASSSS